MQTIPFGSQQVDTLIQNGRVTLHLPDTGALTLTLHSHHRAHGIDHIQAEFDSHLSTITRRGADLFATIATNRGVYRLDGHGGAARVYPHQLLAARTIRTAKDYRHVH